MVIQLNIQMVSLEIFTQQVMPITIYQIKVLHCQFTLFHIILNIGIWMFYAKQHL